MYENRIYKFGLLFAIMLLAIVTATTVQLAYKNMVYRADKTVFVCRTRTYGIPNQYDIGWFDAFLVDVDATDAGINMIICKKWS